MAVAEISRAGSWGRGLRLLLAAIALFATFLVPGIIGNLAAYVALAPVVLSLLLLDWQALGVAMGERGYALFVLAFLLLGIAFDITAKSLADVVLVADFVAFVLVIPAAALFMRLAAAENARRLATLSLAGTVATLIYGAYQVFIQHFDRATGGFSAIFYADLGVLLGFLALGGVFASEAPGRWIYLIGPVMGVVCALLGGTRGAILSAGVLIVLFAIFALAGLPPRQRRQAGIGLVILVVAAAVAAFVFRHSHAISGLESIAGLFSPAGPADRSTILRLDFYRAGVRAFLDSPLWGHGWHQRFSAAMPYMPADAYPAFNPKISHLHNDIINFGSGAGLIGIVAYLLVIAAPLVGAWRSPRDSQRRFRLYAACVLSVGFFAMGLTDVMFVFELPKTFYVLAAAAVMALCLDRPPGALNSA